MISFFTKKKEDIVVDNKDKTTSETTYTVKTKKGLVKIHNKHLFLKLNSLKNKK